MAGIPMAQPAFDTHKAVKALCSAGFDAGQAEAVVDQINGAVNENVATKADLDKLATKEAVAKLATKEELQEAVAKLATKEELRETVARLATKETVARLATKEELQEAVAKLATKEELQEAVAKLATKEELQEAVARLELFVKAEIERHTNRSLKYVLAGAALFVALTKALDLLG